MGGEREGEVQGGEEKGQGILLLLCLGVSLEKATSASSSPSLPEITKYISAAAVDK